jgi:hypothetical protein
MVKACLRRAGKCEPDKRGLWQNPVYLLFFLFFVLA